MRNGICRLCQQSTQLCKSHIVPQRAVDPLKEETGYLLRISGQGPFGLGKVQDGFFDYLLCKECEVFCGREYEKPFMDFWRVNGPKSPWRAHQVAALHVDYPRFKLFHLLNLFRASVCTLSYFRHVDLKGDEEVIRKLLLGIDPGGPHEYSVAARVMYSKQDGMISEAISSPERRSDGGSRTFFSTLYYGVEWTVFVTPGGSKNLRKNALQADGAIVIPGSPWGNHWFLRQAATMLAGKQDWTSS